MSPNSDAHVPDRPTEPQVVHDYTLERLIGRGGFGEVWRARAPGGVLVAVKIIRRPADHEERIREERALEVVKQLYHPFLLTTQQSFSDEKELVIIMQLAECSLRDRLREARNAGQDGLSIEELAPLFREAAEALDYMHSKSVLHRDIKPDNILLLDGHVRLADLGLARLQDQKIMSVSGSGTPYYMAPEVWGGHASAMSDQYSLAYSYAELRLGRRPFSHTDFASLMFDHMQHEPDLGALPEAETAIIRRALAKTPEDRFPSCVKLFQALEKCIPAKEVAEDRLSGPSEEPSRTTEPIEDVPMPPPPLARRSVEPSAKDVNRREKILWAGTLAVAVVMGVVAIVVAVANGRNGEPATATGAGQQAPPAAAQQAPPADVVTRVEFESLKSENETLRKQLTDFGAKLDAKDLRLNEFVTKDDLKSIAARQQESLWRLVPATSRCIHPTLPSPANQMDYDPTKQPPAKPGLPHEWWTPS